MGRGVGAVLAFVVFVSARKNISNLSVCSSRRNGKLQPAEMFCFKGALYSVKCNFGVFVLWWGVGVEHENGGN